MFGYEGYHGEVLVPYDVLHPGDLGGVKRYMYVQVYVCE